VQLDKVPMADVGEAAGMGPVTGVKSVAYGSGSDSGKNNGQRTSFRQRKLNRLSGGAKRKYEPFDEPLPIGYRLGPNNTYERLQLPPDTLASMWRDYHPDSVVVATYQSRPKPPGLFDTVPSSRSPNELLIPTARSTESKIKRQRDLFQRDLTVRVARKHLGYCVGREICEPSPEELAQINIKIQLIFPERSLTGAEVKCWCYHERPLIGEAPLRLRLNSISA